MQFTRDLLEVLVILRASPLDRQSDGTVSTRSFCRFTYFLANTNRLESSLSKRVPSGHGSNDLENNTVAKVSALDLKREFSIER